jgi:phosphate transport system protein
MELEIQSTCIVLIAREQPVAQDLRFIASAMAICTELERIGDDAVSIAKKAITIESDLPADYIGDLNDLSQKVRTMLLNALRAYATDDDALLDQVIAADAEVDNIWKAVRRRLKELMRTDPDQLDAGYKLMQAFHHLEYVGDHAVSIAQRLEFVRTGNLVRFNRAQL